MPRKARPGEDSTLERFFVRTTPEIRRRLAHLAIDLDESIEKMAGKLLAEYIPTVEAEVKSGKRKPAGR